MDKEYREYNEQKAQWLKNHPDATPEQIEEFCKELAKKLNI